MLTLACYRRKPGNMAFSMITVACYRELTRKYGVYDADTCLLPGKPGNMAYSMLTLACYREITRKSGIFDADTCLLPGKPGNMANSMLTLACYREITRKYGIFDADIACYREIQEIWRIRCWHLLVTGIGHPLLASPAPGPLCFSYFTHFILQLLVKGMP